MISSQQLAERLTDARKRAKLTQADVAGRIGVARTTLVAIEKGERKPSNRELVRLSEVLAIPVHDLLRENFVRSELSSRFRLAFGVDRQSLPLAQAVERLRALGTRYAELEQMHGLRRVPARLETLQTYRVDSDQHDTLDARLAGEDAARTVRGMLALGDEPALGLDGRFETEAGLRIFYLDALPATLAGFLLWGDDIGACVAINRDHPPERQRWTLTHELGHFLRDRESGDVLDETESMKRAEEIFPESFTTELLMPRAGIHKRFADRCRAGKFTPVDLSALAQAFAVSFQAMALRLEELRLLPRGSYDKIIHSRIRPDNLAKHDAALSPSRSPRPRLPERYVALAVAAYDRGLLSEGEFAEYLATDVAAARHIYQEHQSIRLEDGTQLPVDFGAGDLRSA